MHAPIAISNNFHDFEFDFQYKNVQLRSLTFSAIVHYEDYAQYSNRFTNCESIFFLNAAIFLLKKIQLCIRKL